MHTGSATAPCFMTKRWTTLGASFVLLASCEALVLETLGRSEQTYAGGRRAIGANEKTFIPLSEPVPPKFQPLRVQFDVGRVRTDLADEALKLEFVVSRVLPTAREFIASMLSVHRPSRLVLRPDCLSWVSQGHSTLREWRGYPCLHLGLAGRLVQWTIG
jgi:hypothetical protein